MLSYEQIEIAVKFWSALFNSQVKGADEQNRFEQSIRKVIHRNRAVLSSIALQVIPHLILTQALKDAKVDKYSLPFRRLEVSFVGDGVYLFERDKFVKSLTEKDYHAEP